MNLVLEIINTPSHSIFETTMTFNQNGGKIGRNKQMDWVLHDPTKYISNFHAEITFSNNQYYITDKSSNGISFQNPQKKLTKNIIAPLTENTVILIGKYEISVKLSNNVFLDQDTPSMGKGDIDNFEIPDQFFTGDETEKAFDIISNKEKSNDILSLIDKNVTTKHNEILPDLNNIMGDFEQTEKPSVGSGLNMHIDMPQMGKENIPEVTTPLATEEAEESLFALLAMKLGIDAKVMSRAEKEAFVIEIANVTEATVEYAQTTGQSVHTIKLQMGITEEMPSNLLMQGLPSSTIFANLHRTKEPLSTHIKSFFHEVNTHNVALYAAISSISLDMLVQFAPQRLYFSFEHENLLNKKLVNKKALAWEAYVDKYRYLDTLTYKEDVDMEKLKKEYKSVLNTLNLGYKK